MTTEIYLDGNATSAVLPAAMQAAVDAMCERYGNPSSTHSTGIRAKALLDGVRSRATRLLGAGKGRLMFNSGATEGIQTAVLSALCALREKRAAGEAIGSLLVYGATEHKAVPESLAHWNRLLGLNLTLARLPVGADGRHDLAALRTMAGDAAFVCTMAANNETGVVSDLEGIAAALEGSRALWMVDCVQALGKLELNLAATRIDYAPFSGHKLYAPKGIGMLYVREGAPYTPLIMGGGQEAGQRSGTENMAGIAALGAVLEALEDGATFRPHAELAQFRDRVAASLEKAFPGIVFNTPFAIALPTTINFSVPGLSSKELLDVFDAAAVRVSAGSACSAAKAAPSYVLDAMGLPEWRSSSAVRLSFGPLADEAMIAEACERIARCGEALRTGAAPLDGVMQLTANGAHTWLVFDAASRQCAVIDSQPELSQRIDTMLKARSYTLAAQLATHGEAPSQDVQLGCSTLRRVPLDAQRSIYLLGDSARVRHAFIGNAAPREATPWVSADTLLCPGSEDCQPCCTSLRAEAHRAREASHLAGVELDGAALDALLRQHPDALLIDVREACEHAADSAGPGGRPAVNVPLSRLASAAAEWMAHGEQPPLVFFCRSGKRSEKAVQCLRRLGYGAAWHLKGGLALAQPMPLAA
ncbi:aminotransferase class V-fold PLP-dependent enzyme [Massilia endophytica]|uniref:aminotransferase class V-fold PLP-dependent enzyme n=1 Tax=Massilia endophytica TaxID=2899220 RepID=UPI001E3B9DD5|nr:aminotransferase class V-fold PLP-dependent enzyme [Massilia endophytica]UGQ46676.1 aminotransferase class V-fold PLP-dependent enzyme [Massilia endophytica]